LESVEPIEAASRALLEAITLSGITIAFALIREPLGLGTLSLPGGAQGVVELFNITRFDGFILLRILSVSGGGLLLFGYTAALYRYLRERIGEVPRDEIIPEAKR
jgi:hypothetical protein